jgi:hypothetical protein
MRIKFEKGEQRKFINLVLKSISCPSLNELINRGLDVTYSSLKNYYSERRCLPDNLFEELCRLGNVKRESLNYSLVENSWGQVKGGRVRFK